MPPKKVAAKRIDPVRARVGKPPLTPLTTELIAEVVNLIEQGAFPLAAARASGIPRRTWYRWLENGMKDDADALVRHLWHSVEKAKGRLSVRLFKTINEAALGHEEPLRDAKGNVIFEEKNGKPVPMMTHIPGNWIAAARALESLTPDEFLRTTGTSPVGGAAEGEEVMPEFEIVYITSNRDTKELAEINRRVQERAGRA